MSRILLASRDSDGNMTCAKCGASLADGKTVDYDLFGENGAFFVFLRMCKCGIRNRYYSRGLGPGAIRYTHNELYAEHVYLFTSLLLNTQEGNVDGSYDNAET